MDSDADMDSDQLIDLAVKHEKAGRRIKAIACYRKVVEGGSDHVDYANNSIKRLLELEKLSGDSNEAIESRIDAAGDDSLVEATNPYTAPNAVSNQLRRKSFDDQGESAEEVCAGNLGLAAMLVKMASVAFAFGALYYAYSNAMQYYWVFSMLDGNWEVMFHFYSVLYIPCFLLLAWQGWRYANSMAKLGVEGADHLPVFAERQAYYWLSFAALVLVALGYCLAEYLFFRAAYSAY